MTEHFGEDLNMALTLKNFADSDRIAEAEILHNICSGTHSHAHSGFGTTQAGNS
jgi:hypothetical protein